MTEKKELNYDELEQITGGTAYDDCGTSISRSNLASYLNQNILATKYTIKYNGRQDVSYDQWFYGQLKELYTRSDNCSTEERAVIYVTESNAGVTNSNVDILIEDFDFYTR